MHAHAVVHLASKDHAMLAATAHPIHPILPYFQHHKTVLVLLAALQVIEHAILAVTAPINLDIGLLLLLKMRIVLIVALLAIQDLAMLAITILAIASLRLLPSA